jgi:hypothetical protein
VGLDAHVLPDVQLLHRHKNGNNRSGKFRQEYGALTALANVYRTLKFKYNIKVWVASLLFENLELLHLWVGLPGDEQAGVTRELVLHSHTVFSDDGRLS